MCLFCNIIQKKISATIVYEDDTLLAFKDIAPKSPTHLLIIPKIHIDSFSKIDTKEEWVAIDYLMRHINIIAKSLGLKEFQIVNNCGKSAGQEVFHIHFHLRSQEAMKDIN